MKEIDLYTDYLSDDEDKYIFMSVNQVDEVEFRLLVSDGFMYTLFLNPTMNPDGFKGITRIWQEDELFNVEDGIIEISDLKIALEDILSYEKIEKNEEIQALYDGLIEILEYSIEKENKLFVSLEET